MLRQRDKFLRTLTLRQAWPRNILLGTHGHRSPNWMEQQCRSWFPSNVEYERPRSIDHTPPEDEE